MWSEQLGGKKNEYKQILLYVNCWTCYCWIYYNRSGWTRRRQTEWESKETIKSEAIEEGESAAKAESEAESKEGIQYGAEPKQKSEEKEAEEAKAEEKE